MTIFTIHQVYLNWLVDVLKLTESIIQITWFLSIFIVTFKQLNIVLTLNVKVSIGPFQWPVTNYWTIHSRILKNEKMIIVLFDSLLFFLYLTTKLKIIWFLITLYHNNHHTFKHYIDFFHFQIISNCLFLFSFRCLLWFSNWTDQICGLLWFLSTTFTPVLVFT